MMVLHVAKKAASISDQTPVLHITHGRAHSPTHVSAPAHPHREHNRALSIPLRRANSNLCLHPHLRSFCTLFLALFCVRISFRGSSRCESSCRLSLIWRSRARLASNASLWSSLSIWRIVHRRNPMLFPIAAFTLFQLAALFRPAGFPLAPAAWSLRFLFRSDYCVGFAPPRTSPLGRTPKHTPSASTTRAKLPSAATSARTSAK